MNCHEFKDAYVDVFYGTADLTIEGKIHRHRLECSGCENTWQEHLRLVGVLRTIPERMPSQVTVNKVLAHAREQAQKNERRSFIFSFLRPLVPAMMGVFALLAYQKMAGDPVSVTGSVAEQTLTENLADNELTMPGEFFHVDQAKPNISYVSTGTTPRTSPFGSQRFGFDDELDRKKLLHNLTLSEVSALFDRARKMEKLREYRQALNDYEFITKFHPDFEYISSVKFSMARCLTMLGSKESAVKLLEEVRKDDPKNEDVEFWLDQIKSETI